MSTNTPKPPKVVVAPEGCMPWFTAGKEYPVVNIWDEWDGIYGYGFNIIDDEGDTIGPMENRSAHLKGKDWIIKEREQ